MLGTCKLGTVWMDGWWLGWIGNCRGRVGKYRGYSILPLKTILLIHELKEIEIDVGTKVGFDLILDNVLHN